jgi:hypothetical protein
MHPHGVRTCGNQEVSRTPGESVENPVRLLLVFLLTSVATNFAARNCAGGAAKLSHFEGAQAGASADDPQTLVQSFREDHSLTVSRCFRIGGRQMAYCHSSRTGEGSTAPEPDAECNATSSPRECSPKRSPHGARMDCYSAPDSLWRPARGIQMTNMGLSVVEPLRIPRYRAEPHVAERD